MMQSMMLTGIRQMESRAVPEPEIRNPSEVKIKMKVVGVCGSDIHYYVHGKIGSQVVKYPFPVGHEGAGEVIAVGSEVRRVRPGDRIAVEPAMPCFACDQCQAGRPHTCRRLRFLGCPGQADGCLSEFLVMPESSCFPIPDTMSWDEAALSEPLAIGVYAVKQSVPLAGLRIGILGFGPIGMSVLLAARAAGAAAAMITDKIDERLQRARDLAVDWAGNPDQEDVVQAILKREPQGLDVVFECCGQQEAMDQAVEMLKPGGKIMIVGIPQIERWSFHVDKLRHKEITLGNVRRQNDALEETLEGIASRRLNVLPMVTHRFPFAETQQAFDLVADYQQGVMKAMVDF